MGSENNKVEDQIPTFICKFGHEVDDPATLSTRDKKSYDELLALRDRRLSILNRLWNLHSQIAKYVDEDLDFYIFKSSMGLIPRLEAQFHDVQDEITKNYFAVQEDEDQNDIAFMSLLHKMQRQANFLIADMEKAQRRLATPIDTNVVKVKLPQQQIPEFHGDITGWRTFKDTFVSLIHDNVSIPAIQKFHYLSSALKGNTLNSIKEIPITADNYEEAWEILCERYDNTNLLIDAHLERLTALKTVAKDNAVDLRELVDSVQSNVRALSALKVPVEHWDAMLVYIIKQRLDVESKKQWQLQNNTKELPTYDSLISFLNNRCRMLEAIQSQKTTKEPNEAKASITQKSKYKPLTTHAIEVNHCPVCQGTHRVYYCPDFLKLDPKQRKEKVRELKLCYKCLGNHIKDCPTKHSCRICNQAGHNTLLHVNSTNQKEEEPKSSKKETIHISHNSCIQVHCNKTSPTNTSQVLLGTARILVADTNGNWYTARALLDSASQSCFITENYAQKLSLVRKRIEIPVSGINQIRTNIKHKVTATFKSNTTVFQGFADFLVVSKIANEMPTTNINTKNCNIPANIQLADPYFHQSGRIDILIGTQYFYDLLGQQRIDLGVGKPSLIETELGWIVAGSFATRKPATVNSLFSFFVQTANELREADQKVSIKCRTLEESKCEQHFKETVKRTEDGRYVVRLPVKAEAKLGESRSVALRKLKHNQKQFEINPELKQAYYKFMEEYQQLGHMEALTEQQSKLEHPYYIPHHPVFKSSSTTTKIRVVFNASSKSSNGLSLNDILMVGPNIQTDLRCLLIEFTLFKYVFVADIEKMFRQVQVDEEDRDYQRILWFDSHGNLKDFRLNTVTYGTASATFQTLRVLRQAAQDEKQRFPRAAKLVRKFYMDDEMAGGNDVLELAEDIKQLTGLLASAGMNLRKFAANDSRLLEGIPQSNIESLVTIQDHENTITTLGLIWSPQADEFMYKIPNTLQPQKWTKRLVSSEIHKLFDPVGWIGPVILLGNLLMQKLWMEELDWDEPLPEHLTAKWLELYGQLPLLQHIQKRRQTAVHNNRVELHGFSDASMKSYGAAIYVRSVSETGEVAVQLLTSQSRVAPQPNKKRKNPITLPKLELNAALILSRLIAKIEQTVEYRFDEVFLRSDSTIVLAWIGENPDRLIPYVGRRVAEIQNLTPLHSWSHVDTKQNPADIISRGMYPQTLLSSKLWWMGPQFLWNLKIESSKPPSNNNNDQLNCYYTRTNSEEDSQSLINISKFSDYSHMVRVTAWILRYVHNRIQTRNQRELRTGSLFFFELLEAEKILAKQVQKEAFSKEISQLKKKQQIDSKSKLLSLNPYLKNDLLLVGGRLQNSNIPENRKHPIIIPSNHHFTQLLIQKVHQDTLHGGTQLVLSTVRLRFWVLRGRSSVKDVIRNCLDCFRVNPQRIDQIMGNLPPERVIPNRPFAVTGLDYCGFFYVQNKTPRPTALIKIWVCVFVCFVTKAAHLEPVMDLTTEAFRNALIRFRSRRGHCTILNCDNQTTFHGAKKQIENEIQDFMTDPTINAEIKDLCVKDGLIWKFIPARSPHVGGLWESCVKSFKYHYKRVTGNVNLTIESFFTLTYTIESCLNSRPLMPLTEDCDDVSVLTPGHFLIGEPLNAPPEPDISLIPYNKLNMFEKKQKALQIIWKQWSRDYLNTLQQRNKWKIEKKDLKVGDLALIIEDNLPPLKWLMGRIVNVSTGPDGRVRIVDLKTPQRIIRRSVQRICPLPIPRDDLE